VEALALAGDLFANELEGGTRSRHYLLNQGATLGNLPHGAAQLPETGLWTLGDEIMLILLTPRKNVRRGK